MPTTLEATITLNCLVLGEDIRNVFPVEINETETVGALKELIKSERAIAFRDVDAYTLVLWKAPESLSCDGDNDAFKETIEGLDLQDERGLLPVRRLSHIFSDPHPECLHIIVKAPGELSLIAHFLHSNRDLSGYSTPETIITLNCLVSGGGCRNIFSVKIDKTETVGTLKNLIKSKKPIAFRNVDANTLVLWKLEVPESLLCDDDTLKETIKSFNLQAEHSLFPVNRLSQIFPKTPNPDHLHIFVEPPTSVQHWTADEQVKDEGDILTELNAKFERTCQLGKDLTPSTAEKSSEYIQIKRNGQQRICDGRYAVDKPADTNAVPIQLFNPAFAYFSSKVFDPAYDVPLDFTRRVQNLMTGFSAIHRNEEDHAIRLRPLLQEVLGRPLTTAQNGDKTIPGAMVLSSYKHFQIYLIVSEKNEFGDGGSDPSAQASFSFLRVFCQEQTKALRMRCCCPTFLITHAGPWLAVLGGIITSECIVQRLTDYIWVPIHSAHDDHQYFRIGRVLYALKESIHRLEEWYKTTIETVEPYVFSPHPPSHPRFFPSPDAYLRDGVRVKFQYLKPLQRHISCVTYLARTVEANNSINIVVKFVTKYGADLHREMAAAGFAPNLFYCGPIEVDGDTPSYGDLQMVVMEYVDGLMLPKRLKKIPAGLQSTLRQMIKCLHHKGFVFGDLRNPDIMITKEDDKAQLIDFEWAGKGG
ncbi:hypothetical protein PAXINDRAFT_100881 [Paxillus involutus ATCC 200175]|uniref:Crinkler effector protein N-terminal domain-containing protein n=1 Tax=Paxillus involutus ATCC 200175 TaxID=664439 RepID=A0A0C9U0K5_PAXIN|nr:hypothetical protein PAXINDRAFT_100881 [Paxillus involutus ATCC 200175]